MSLMDHLLKLYEVDRQVRGLRSRLDSAHRYLTAQTGQLEEAMGRQRELEARQRQLQATIANLDVEGAALDGQLEKFRTDLNSSVTNKQYTAVLTELNTVKEARSKLDDSILAHMEQIEELGQQLEEVASLVSERAKVRDLASRQLQEREDDVGSRLAELEAERTVASSAIPGAALSVFEEIAGAYEGEAMAAVEEINRRRREYACGACNLHMPFGQVAALMGPGDDLVRCTACGRILYLQDEVRGALAPK